MRMVISLMIVLLILTACQSSGDATRYATAADEGLLEQGLDRPPIVPAPSMTVTDVLSPDPDEDMEIILNNGALGKVIKHGRSYILKGTNFGYKVPAEPLLWDTVANQEAYAGLSHFSEIPLGQNGLWWGSDCGYFGYNTGLCFPIRYWSEDPRVNDVASYAIDQGAQFRYSNVFQESNYVYLSWWVHSSTGLDNGYLVRYLSIMNEDMSRVSLYNGRLIYYSDANHDGVPRNDYRPITLPQNDNVWHNFELTIDLRENPQSGYGKVFVDIDGERVATADDVWSKTPYSMFMNFGYDSYAEEATGESIFISEFYMDNSPAKILLCDASTYSATRHCELQTPELEWKKQSIQFVANQGSFGHNEQVYMYVLTPEGNVNAKGYALKVVGEPDEISHVNTCADEDAGFEVLTSGCTVGYLEGELYEVCDTCLDATTLNEVFCSGDFSTFESAECLYPDGSPAPCINGACIDDSCTDSDGSDVLNRGFVEGYLDGVWTTKTDSCIRAGSHTYETLEEFICDSNHKIVEKNYQVCDVFCWEGVCVDEVPTLPITCTDTDGGYEKYTKGTIHGIGDVYWRYPEGREVTYTDHCNTGPGVTGLVEYYCDDFGFVRENTLFESTCACVNGVCTI